MSDSIVVPVKPGQTLSVCLVRPWLQLHVSGGEVLPTIVFQTRGAVPGCANGLNLFLIDVIPLCFSHVIKVVHLVRHTPCCMPSSRAFTESVSQVLRDCGGSLEEFLPYLCHAVWRYSAVQIRCISLLESRFCHGSCYRWCGGVRSDTPLIWCNDIQTALADGVLTTGKVLSKGCCFFLVSFAVFCPKSSETLFLQNCSLGQLTDNILPNYVFLISLHKAVPDVIVIFEALLTERTVCIGD